jgi:hypothetical protein
MRRLMWNGILEKFWEKVSEAKKLRYIYAYSVETSSGSFGHFSGTHASHAMDGSALHARIGK